MLDLSHRVAVDLGRKLSCSCPWGPHTAGAAAKGAAEDLPHGSSLRRDGGNPIGVELLRSYRTQPGRVVCRTTTGGKGQAYAVVESLKVRLAGGCS